MLVCIVIRQDKVSLELVIDHVTNKSINKSSAYWLVNKNVYLYYKEKQSKILLHQSSLSEYKNYELLKAPSYGVANFVLTRILRSFKEKRIIL